MSRLSLTWLLLVPGLAACTSDKDAGEGSDSSTSEDSDSSWWDVSDDTADDDGNDDGKDTGKDDGKDTGKSGGEAEIGTSWDAEISTDLSGGTMNFTHVAESGDSCKITVDLTNLASLDDCTECSFAMSMELANATITSDLGGCDDLEVLEGQTLALGQEADGGYEYSGITWYGIQLREDDAWDTVSNGYGGLSDGDSLWYLGVK